MVVSVRAAVGGHAAGTAACWHGGCNGVGRAPAGDAGCHGGCWQRAAAAPPARRPYGHQAAHGQVLAQVRRPEPELHKSSLLLGEFCL